MALAFRPEPSLWQSPAKAGGLFTVGLLLPVIAATLGGIGVLALYSAAGGAMEPFAMSHLTRLIIGIALLLLLAILPARLWLVFAAPLYVAALGLLGAVPWIGATISGSQRWLSLAGMSVQPAEIMKLALVLALAAYYQMLPRHLVSRPLYVLLPLAIVAVPAGLVLEQPDLGTALLIVATGLVMMFLAGVGGLYFVAGIVSVAVLAPVLWANLHDYQRERVLVFLDPERDLLGAGYQVYQARIALAAGGMSGKGFLEGTQTSSISCPRTIPTSSSRSLARNWVSSGHRAFWCCLPLSSWCSVCFRWGPAAGSSASPSWGSRCSSSCTLPSIPAWSSACCRWSACRCRWSPSAAPRC